MHALATVTMVLLIAGAGAAAGFWAAVSVRHGDRRGETRARGPFLVGVFCGFMAAVAMTGKRHGLRAAGGALAQALPMAASILRRRPPRRGPARFAAVPNLRTAWSQGTAR